MSLKTFLLLKLVSSHQARVVLTFFMVGAAMVIQQSSPFCSFLKYTTLITFFSSAFLLLFVSSLWATPPISLSVGNEPESLTINPTSNQAIVAHKGSQNLQVIDLSTKTVVSTIALGSRPSGVAVNSQSNIAIVTLEKLDSIRVIDLSNGATLADVAVGKDPKAVALDSALNIAVVANEKDDTVSLVNLATYTVVSTLV